MQFNKNRSVAGRESSSGPQRSSPSILGRVRNVAYTLVGRLNRSPAGSNSTTSVSASNSGDELNSSDAESFLTINTVASSAEGSSSCEDVISSSEAVEPIDFQDTQPVGHTGNAEPATAHTGTNVMDAVTRRLQNMNDRNSGAMDIRRVINSRNVTPDPTDISSLPFTSGTFNQEQTPSNLIEERDISPSSSPSSSSSSFASSCSAYSSAPSSPEPRVGRLVPAVFSPLRPLDPRSYGGFRDISTRPIPPGYHGEAHALPPTFQPSMPYGLVRQGAYEDINNRRHRHGLRRESVVHEDTHRGLRPPPREQWWKYTAIVKDDPDEDSEDPDSPHSGSYPSSSSGSPRPGPSSGRRPHPRHRAPSPPSPRRNPTPNPSNLGRSHNVSDRESQSPSARSRRSRRSAPYRSPSSESSELESRPSASMYRRPNPQTARASLERRRQERESVSASEHDVKREPQSPPPLPSTDAAPSVSISTAPTLSSISVAAPSRRRRSSPRMSPYSIPSSSLEEAEETSPSTLRRSARISAANARDKARRKERERQMTLD